MFEHVGVITTGLNVEEIAPYINTIQYIGNCVG